MNMQIKILWRRERERATLWRWFLPETSSGLAGGDIEKEEKNLIYYMRNFLN